MSKREDKRQVINGCTCMLLLMCLFANSCKTQESSTPTCSMDANISVSDQIKVEECLGIRLTKYRDIHFHELPVMGIGYYTTLISFEVPTKSLKLLLEQSPKLPSYGEFTKNAKRIAFLEQVAKDIDWWKPAQLKNSVSGQKSWCSQYEGDKCIIYGIAGAAFAKVESGWVRIYICHQIEMLPDKVPEMLNR